MRVVKAHAFGNDFLLVEESEIAVGVDRSALARGLCERHRGLGADGLIVSAFAPGASMRSFGTCVRMDLLNADGSYSEVSGNGVRCQFPYSTTTVSFFASVRTASCARTVAPCDRHHPLPSV